MFNVTAIVAVVLGLVVVGAGGWGWGYRMGIESVADQWAAEKKAVAEAHADALIKAAKESVRIVEKWRTRVEKVEVRGETIREQVPVYIPQPVVLSGGFRLLHDAAASGDELPAAPGGTAITAAAVDEATAARTITDNYTTCRLNAEQLAALQEFVRQRMGAPPQ